MKVPGPGSAYPSVQTQGQSVVAIKGRAIMTWSTAPGGQLDKSGRLVMGVYVGPYQYPAFDHDTAPEAQEPFSEWHTIQCANTTDWLYWDPVPTSATQANHFQGDATAGFTTVREYEFFVKSRRRIRELHDTVILSCLMLTENASDAAQLSLTTSTLLAKRR